MLDEMLSRSGRRVATAAGIVFALLIIGDMITEWGPAGWLNELQGQLTGYYSLKVTVAVLLVPAMLGAYGLAFLWDGVTRQGRWRPRSKVRIIQSSRGPAPDAFREAWVGLVVPVVAGEPTLQPDTREVCYLVPAEAGLRLLAQASPEAASWWRERMPDARRKVFRFPASNCEPVE